jgi:hypothetical protein
MPVVSTSAKLPPKFRPFRQKFFKLLCIDEIAFLFKNICACDVVDEVLSHLHQGVVAYSCA